MSTNNVPKFIRLKTLIDKDLDKLAEYLNEYQVYVCPIAGILLPSEEFDRFIKILSRYNEINMQADFINYNGWLFCREEGIILDLNTIIAKTKEAKEKIIVN